MVNNYKPALGKVTFSKEKQTSAMLCPFDHEMALLVLKKSCSLHVALYENTEFWHNHGYFGWSGFVLEASQRAWEPCNLSSWFYLCALILYPFFFASRIYSGRNMATFKGSRCIAREESTNGCCSEKKSMISAIKPDDHCLLSLITAPLIGITEPWSISIFVPKLTL